MSEVVTGVISQDELEHALVALFPDWIYDGVVPAAEVFDYVTRHYRTPPEPEYIEGEIYQDAGGDAWYRTYNRKKPWTLVQHSGKRYAHDVPTRPLRRLVPEEIDTPQPEVPKEDPFAEPPPYVHVYYGPDAIPFTTGADFRCT